MKTILIIEDENDLAELLAFNLKNEGYRTIIARDGSSGLLSAQSIAPDLILLDLMLPGMPGIDICKALKSSQKTVQIPIVILTAKGEEIDRVVGFEIGADDYMVKPFSTRELLLRIKAVLRRANHAGETNNIIKVTTLAIDTDRHIVTIEGKEVLLTTTEFKLLLCLAERLGRVQSREQLLRTAWGMAHIGDTRTVDTHITRLRTKLGVSGDLIKTIRGFGYKMEKE